MTERSTTVALIDAAEDHFASDGFERASLRAVMRDAGTDPGAVHYHFGGRAELAEAVLDRVLVPLNDQRLGRLAALEERGERSVTVESLVGALIRPDLEMADELETRGRGRGRLIGNIYLNPASYVTAEVELRFGPVAARFHPHFVRVLPDVPGDVLAWRVRWCLFGTLGALLTDPAGQLGGPQDETADRLVATIAGALAARATTTKE